METLIEAPAAVKQENENAGQPVPAWYAARRAETKGGYSARAGRVVRKASFATVMGIKLLRLPRLTPEEREKRIRKYERRAYVEAPLFE